MSSDLSFSDRLSAFEALVGFRDSFDLLRRDFSAGGRRCVLYLMDGATDQEFVSLFLTRMMSAFPGDFPAEALPDSFLPCGEIDRFQEDQEGVFALFCGISVLFIDCVQGCWGIDARSIPQRQINEPDKERTLRGSHDGFVELLTNNTALIRRRVRSRYLHFEKLRSGAFSKSEVVLAYMSDRADLHLVGELRTKILSCPAEALVMNQESLSEHLFRKNPWNPFPKIRQTERPDAASAALLEGKIILLADNSSTAMILPASLFDFFTEANDYYFPPPVGSYFRMVRVLMLLTALFLTPLVLLVNNLSSPPGWLSVLIFENKAHIPLYAQFMVYELLIGMLRLSALNIPHNIGSAMTLVSGVIVGQFAVDAGWATPEVVFFMAFVAITIYAQQNLEFGYTMKFLRIFYLTATELFSVWGFFVAPALIFLLLLFQKQVNRKPYLEPLIPFRPKAFGKIFFRSRIKR